jgi:hypothetical protein
MVQAEEPAKQPEHEGLEQHERMIQSVGDSRGPAEGSAVARSATLPAGIQFERRLGADGATQLGVAPQT